MDFVYEHPFTMPPLFAARRVATVDLKVRLMSYPVLRHVTPQSGNSETLCMHKLINHATTLWLSRCDVGNPVGRRCLQAKASCCWVALEISSPNHHPGAETHILCSWRVTVSFFVGRLAQLSCGTRGSETMVCCPPGGFSPIYMSTVVPPTTLPPPVTTPDPLPAKCGVPNLYNWRSRYSGVGAQPWAARVGFKSECMNTRVAAAATTLLVLKLCLSHCNVVFFCQLATSSLLIFFNEMYCFGTTAQ